MELNYAVEGDGEALVFIHGLSDNLLYWEALAAALRREFKVVRFDLRGHGKSPLGEDEISIGTYANDLKSLLDELDITKANLIGFSLGGAVAMDFALKFPNRVSSLVLMSTFYKCDDDLAGVFNQFIDALDSSFEDFFDFMLPKVLCPDVIENNREELEFLKQESSKTANIDAYKIATKACFKYDVENQLSQISVPTLILAGKYDEIFPKCIQESLSNKIKNSKLIVFDNSKHNLLVGKNNVEIVEILKKFYKKR